MMATAKNDQDPLKVFKKMYFHNLNYQEIVLYCSFRLIKPSIKLQLDLKLSI